MFYWPYSCKEADWSVKSEPLSCLWQLEDAVDITALIHIVSNGQSIAADSPICCSETQLAWLFMCKDDLYRICIKTFNLYIYLLMFRPSIYRRVSRIWFWFGALTFVGSCCYCGTLYIPLIKKQDVFVVDWIKQDIKW